MSLREVGQSIGGALSGLEQGLTDGLAIALNESFWDWPLWISIPAAIFGLWLLWALFQFFAGLLEYALSDEPAELAVVAMVGAVAALSGFVTYDIYFGTMLFQDDARDRLFVSVAAPAFAVFTGLYFVIAVIKLVRHTWKNRAGKS